MKERTLQWLSAQIWSLRGSGLRGIKKDDSRLVRRASRPLIGSGSCLPSGKNVSPTLESAVSSDYLNWLVSSAVSSGHSGLRTSAIRFGQLF